MHFPSVARQIPGYNTKNGERPALFLGKPANFFPDESIVNFKSDHFGLESQKTF